MIRAVTLLCALAASSAAQSRPEPQLGLAGRTLDAKGQPLRKISLSLRPLATNAAGDSLAPYGVTSDDDGVFEFYGVRPGRYRLMAERAGYRQTLYGARNAWAPGAVLTLRAGAPLTGVTVRLVEQAVLAGKVVTDEPANSWVVQLYEQQYQNGQRRWVCIDARGTGSSGEFNFNKLRAGRYRLAATGAFGVVDDDELTYVATYYPGVTDPASAETIELRPGQVLSDIRLPRIKGTKATCSLSGSIVRNSTSSSVRPMVYMSAVGSDWAEYVSVARDRFQRDALKCGSYILGVLLDKSRAERRLAGRQIVQVSGEVEAPAFDLDSIGLRGAVKFEGGAPPGAKLWVKLLPVEDPTPYYAQAEVGADGTFAIPGSFAGPFRIEVEGLPADAYVKSALYGEKDALGVLDLAFQAGDEKLAIVIGAAGARTSGVVRDEKGDALDGIVTLIPDPPEPQKMSLYRLAETDANGRFQFQGLRPGKYRLHAWQEFESGAQFDPEVTAPLQAGAMTIELGEGERKEVTVSRISVDEAEAARRR